MTIDANDLDGLLNTIKIRRCVTTAEQLREIGISVNTYNNLKKGNNTKLLTIGKVIKYLKAQGMEIETIIFNGVKIIC